jgi:HAD superfamily hydrolase (TIGR01459 family)
VTRILRGLAGFAGGYDVILCDVWGVIHNGLTAFQKAAGALSRFRAMGGKVVLMTNSPNPSRIVEAQLGRLSVSREAYDAIVSSGDVTVSLLLERAGAGLFRIGPPEETALFVEVLARRGAAPRLVPLKQAQFVLCTGLADPWRETPEDYDAILAAMRARRLELICANPDIVVEDGGKLFYCAGAIAERYAAAGGKVIQAGKPFAPIYARALELARGPGNKTIGRSRVLVIGDAMQTDIKGAHLQGFDSLFVTSGIHRKELHGGAKDAALDAAAFRQFLEASDFAPTAALPELVW